MLSSLWRLLARWRCINAVEEAGEVQWRMSNSASRILMLTSSEGRTTKSSAV